MSLSCLGLTAKSCFSFGSSDSPVGLPSQTLYFSIRAFKRNRILHAHHFLRVLTPHRGHELAPATLSLLGQAGHCECLSLGSSGPTRDIFAVGRNLLKRTARVFWSSFPTSPFIPCYFYTESSSSSSSSCIWSLSRREHAVGTLCYQLRPLPLPPSYPPNGAAGSFLSPHVYLHAFQSLSVPLLLHFLNN